MTGLQLSTLRIGACNRNFSWPYFFRGRFGIMVFNYYLFCATPDIPFLYSLLNGETSLSTLGGGIALSGLPSALVSQALTFKLPLSILSPLSPWDSKMWALSPLSRSRSLSTSNEMRAYRVDGELLNYLLFFPFL